MPSESWATQPNRIKQVNTFKVGQTYTARSVCDHNCTWSFTVTRRTAKFVTIESADGKKTRAGIKTDFDGNEYALPMGSFSMAPCIRA
jgi:hypothetical protein